MQFQTISNSVRPLLIALLTLVSLLLTGCDKETDVTPVEAEAGSFVVYIEGKLVKSVVVKATTSNNNSSINMSAWFVEKDTTRIDLGISNSTIYAPLTSGEYTFNGNDPPVHEAVLFYLPDDGKGFYSSNQIRESIAGKLSITHIDPIKREISGSFEVNLIRGMQTIKLTHGSFNKISYTQ